MKTFLNIYFIIVFMKIVGFNMPVELWVLLIPLLIVVGVFATMFGKEFYIRLKEKKNADEEIQ